MTACPKSTPLRDKAYTERAKRMPCGVPGCCDDERWKIVQGFPGYEISSCGRLRRATDGSNSKAGRMLNPPIGNLGYPRVNLSNNCKVRGFSIHTLVATAFIGPAPFKRAQVAHYDGSRTNNHVSNLRWTDAKGNAADRDRHGRWARGEQNYGSKLTNDAIREIRKSKERQRVLAKKYGVSQRAIWNAFHKVTWRHI